MATFDIYRDLPAFVANSAMSSAETATHLALQTANQLVPFLASLAGAVNENVVGPVTADTFLPITETRALAAEFKVILDHYGSDKATFHAYHEIYAAILRDREKVERVLEIGLGTNNTDVASNMGPAGRPGASLRAFRDFLPNALIFGADVDRRILFAETRIATFFVDQTAPETFRALASQLRGEFDLIIDDGLHAMNANLSTLEFGLGKIRPRGWVVIEDIPTSALPLWGVVRRLLPAVKFHSEIVATRTAFLFVVQRLH
jgi:hypothetical protein